MPRRKTEYPPDSHIVILVSPDCPICKSLLRWYKIQTIGTTPVYIVDVSTLSTKELMEIYGLVLTPLGVSLQVTVPRFLVYCNGKIIYNKEIRPQFPAGFSEHEARAILMMLKSQLNLCIKNQQKGHVSESTGSAITAGETETGRKVKGRRRGEDSEGLLA